MHTNHLSTHIKRHSKSHSQRASLDGEHVDSADFGRADWPYDAMIGTDPAVRNASSDNRTDSMTCVRPDLSSNGGRTRGKGRRARPILARLSSVQHKARRDNQLSSRNNGRQKSHSHDGILVRELSPTCDSESTYFAYRQLIHQGMRFCQQQQQQQHQQQHHCHKQLHIPNASPDLLNSWQLRRQVARYSNSVPTRLDEEQIASFNGSGNINNNSTDRCSTVNSDFCEDTPLTVLGSLTSAVLASWLNVLIIFVPLGYIAHYLKWPAIVVFVLNFFAIIPLSALMGFTTEEVSIRFGPTWGGVMNATFGNTVELIIAVIALIKEEYRIVQAGLIGSVLSNTLLVLGCAFLAGGLRHSVQLYHAEAAQCAGALLALSVLSMIIPAAYHNMHASDGKITNGILVMSRGTALILLIVYILFLVFQLKTHSEIFDGTHIHANSDSRNQCPYHSEKHETDQMELDMIDSKPSLGLNTHPLDTKVPSKNNSISKDSGAVIDAKFIKETRECHLRHSAPLMIMWVAILLLIVVFGLVVLSSDILVDSVEELTTHYNISHTFVGMILLPIASNAAEHTMSVTVALRNKMDLCISVAVGSSMQMTLFVLPLLIIIAWFLSRPLTLFFDDFETTTMLISVLVFNYLIMNGRSNWLKGAMLLCSYSIVALAFFLYPNELDNVRGNVAANFVSSTSLPISAAKLTEPTLSSSKLSFL